MSGGISWEQLHAQISDLLPLLDPKVGRVVGQTLAQGRKLRTARGSADPSLDDVLDQVAAMLTTLSRTEPESNLLSAAQHLLLGVLPMAVLTTHLVAAWPQVQAARRALMARPVPPFAGSLRGPEDGPRPEELAWMRNSRHEAGAAVVASTSRQ